MSRTRSPNSPTAADDTAASPTDLTSAKGTTESLSKYFRTISRTNMTLIPRRIPRKIKVQPSVRVNRGKGRGHAFAARAARAAGALRGDQIGKRIYLIIETSETMFPRLVNYFLDLSISSPGLAIVLCNSSYALENNLSCKRILLYLASTNKKYFQPCKENFGQDLQNWVSKMARGIRPRRSPVAHLCPPHSTHIAT